MAASLDSGDSWDANIPELCLITIWMTLVMSFPHKSVCIVKVERCLLNCNAWEEEQKVYRDDMQTVRDGRASVTFEDGEEHDLLTRRQHVPRS